MSFIFNANAGETPESNARKRRIAEALRTQGTDTSPVASPWQGVARVAQALTGAVIERRANKAEASGRESARDSIIKALTSNDSAGILETMQNPWMSPVQQRLLGDRYKQITDPNAEIDMQLKKAQLNKLSQPNFESVGKGQNLYDPATKQWISPPAGVSADDTEYGLQPIVTQDADGKYHLFQASKAGGPPKEIELPFGWTPQQQFLDTGTGFQAVPKQGVGHGAVIPKDLAGAEAQKEIGTATGKQIAAAPADVQAADNALGLLDQIETDPNMDWGVGASSVLNPIPGTPGRDFQSRVDQAKSGAFLSAIQQMRGMGSLSNAEGDTATKAVTRLNTATSKQEFLSALREYRGIIQKGKAKAAARLGPQATTIPEPIQSPATQNGDAGWTVLPNGVKIRRKGQ